MELLKKTRNQFEAKLHSQLKRSKVRFEYEAEKIPYLIAGHYIPDWTVHTPLGKILIEAKGYFRPESKRKLVAVKKLNPNLDIRIVFYAHRETYIRWAERHGFKWAVGTIPSEWLEGL